MPDVVATLAGREARQTFAEQRPERVKRSTAGLANDGFEFGETELDGVEVGAIGGQEPERGAGRFNGQEPAQLGMTQVLTRDDPGMRLSRAQRLTGRATELGVPRPDPPSVGGVSREALTCAPPGPRKPARETIARIPAPPRSRRVSSSRRRARDRRNRPASTEKTRGRPRAIPECEHQPDWVAVGAVSSEPVSHVDKRIKDEYLMGPYYVPLHTP